MGNKFKYQTARSGDGQIVITSSKEIDQTKLSSDCWLIQFNGLSACDSCELLGDSECGGKKLRKKLLKGL